MCDWSHFHQIFYSIKPGLVFWNLELFYIYITENEETDSLFQIFIHRVKQKEDEHPYLRPIDSLTAKHI